MGRLFWIILNAIATVIITERQRKITQRQEDSVTMEAEIGRMEPPAKECLQPPKAGRAG